MAEPDQPLPMNIGNMIRKAQTAYHKATPESRKGGPPGGMGEEQTGQSGSQNDGLPSGQDGFHTDFLKGALSRYAASETSLSDTVDLLEKHFRGLHAFINELVNDVTAEPGCPLLMSIDDTIEKTRGAYKAFLQSLFDQYLHSWGD